MPPAAHLRGLRWRAIRNGHAAYAAHGAPRVPVPPGYAAAALQLAHAAAALGLERAGRVPADVANRLASCFRG